MGISIKILIFVALVVGTTVALRPLQLTLQDRIEKFRDGYINKTEAYWGRKIQYGSIGPSIFGVLDIRNVRVLREDDSEFLSIARLRLSYSLPELLRGNIWEALRSVRFDRPVLSLDFKKDADLAERLSSPGGQENNPSSAKKNLQNFRDLLPENFSFRIWNGEWELSGPAGSFRIQNVGLDASVRLDKISFQGRWDAAASLNSGSGPATLLTVIKSMGSSQALEAFMNGRVRGEYSVDMEDGSATVEIPSFYGNYFRGKPLTIGFFLSNGRLEARKTHDNSPTAISLVYDLEGGSLQGRFEGENFSPQDLFVLTGSWQNYNPWLAFRITGNVGFETDSSGRLLYSMDFSGALPVDSFPGPASLNVKASGSKDRLQVDTLDIHSAYGSLKFRGGMGFDPVTPYGSLSLSDFRPRRETGRGGGISGDFSLSTQGREIDLFAENLSVGNIALSGLDASVFQEDKGLSFAVSALRFRNTEDEDINSYENVRMGKFSLEGSLDYNPGHFHVNLNLDSFSVGDMLAIAEPLTPLPDIPPIARSVAKDLSVTTEVFFNTDYKQLYYNAPRIVIAYEGVTDIMAAASLSGTDKKFELSEGSISWGKGAAEISGSVDFSDTNDISFSIGATHKDLTYFFEGMVLEHKDISIRGSYGFQVYLSSGKAGEYSGYAQGENIPFPSGDKLASLSFLVSLFYNSPASWQAAIEKFEITGLTTPCSSFASLHFSGSASQTGMTIPNLFFDDGRGALAGNISLNWDSSYSFCHFRADISGNEHKEYYNLSGTYQNKRLDLDLSGQGMQLSRISTQNAVAGGSVRLSWESPQSFALQTELTSLTLYRQNDTIKASAQASLNSTTLRINLLNINYSGLQISVPNFSIDRAACRADVKAGIRGNLSGSPVELSFRGEARFVPTETWLDMIQNLGSLDGSLTVDSARYENIEAPEPFALTFACLRKKEGFTLNLSGGPRNMIRFRYSPEVSGGGSFYVALSAPSPVRGAITGFIDTKTIDAQGSDLYVDLGSLWRFMPTSAPVAFPGGIVNASIRVTGSLTDPEFYGTARGTSIQILVPGYIPEPIRPVPMTISLNGTEMTFGPVDAAVGRGGGKVSAFFRFDQWIPSVFSIDIQVPQETPIPYKFDIAGVIANGLVGGKLVVAMEDKILSVTGDLSADNTEISLNGSELAAMENGQVQVDDSGISTVSDISIRTGRRVQFFWPTTNLPVLQANADMGTGIHITSDSASKRFTLTGDVKLRSGEIFYLERNFYLREGTLFFKENETNFDPSISARAEIRDQTADNSPVTIAMIIDKAPIRSFTPRFESTPPLSQLEIYSILGQSPLGEGGGGGEQRNIAASVAFDSLTQFAVMRRLQQRVRDFFGLDMLSLRTQLLQNVVLQATSSNHPKESSDTTVERAYRVGNYFDNTTVFLGKYIGSAMFAQAMVSLKYDETKQTMGGLRLEPEIGLEMRNPLFDIHFNIVPLHPENWFIADTSISLIWRKSF